MSFLADLALQPHTYDFFQAMRRVECMHADKPRWGEARTPAQEPWRLGQDPSLAFAAASIERFIASEPGNPPRLEVNFFGLLGPEGALPLHLTEYARDRLRHHDDPTFARFLDVLQHRFYTMFYRAWAQAQPTVGLDRRNQNRFGRYVGALCGVGAKQLHERDALPDFAKLHLSGWLSHGVRCAEGLVAVLQEFFERPIRVEQYVGHWIAVQDQDATRIGRANGFLGRGAVLGTRVWDRQSKFRIHIGPVQLREYEAFLPGGTKIEALLAWVQNYVGLEFSWDARLRLASDAVPKTELGAYGRLGWTTWLGKRRTADDAEDLTLDAERLRSHALRGNQNAARQWEPDILANVLAEPLEEVAS
jgi:type VI secretion system protein ImpH